MLVAMSGPTAEIHLDRLSHNLNCIRRRLAENVEVLVAVKADAYGHGAVPVAKHLLAQGVVWLGVATPEEALGLRTGGVQANILIFSPVYNRVAELIEADVALCIADEASWAAVKATGLQKQANLHLKVDTGMGRLGLPPAEALELAEVCDRASCLEGVWTHFACADELERGFTHCQLEAFAGFRAGLAERGIQPRLTHAANSAGVFAYPESHFGMVRPGIAVYGYHSSPFISSLEPDLKPALTLSAPVTFIKQVAAGTPVSYGATWRAPKNTTIATVRIGYADGYPRGLSARAEALVQGVRCRVTGRICMDQLMVDVGSLDVSVGERVTLLGDGLDAETLAAQLGTISYELLTSIAGRVRRIYR